MNKLVLPDNEKTKEMKVALAKFGIPEKDIDTKAWNAIRKVLASKYNIRAFIATKKIGISLKDIRMAVLIQNAIPAEYAFVIHTKNPLNGDSKEIYAELVKGLGETLVGSYAGQSFSFIFNKGNL
jgi:alpha-glucan,water dikinase